MFYIAGALYVVIVFGLLIGLFVAVVWNVYQEDKEHGHRK